MNKNFISTSAACCLVMLSSNTSSASEAQNQSIGGYLSSGVATGNYDGDSWRKHSFDGALYFPVIDKVNIQFDGRFREYSIGEGVAGWGTAGQRNAVGATIFWRDPNFGRFGLFYDSGIVESWKSNFKSSGIHAELFLNEQIDFGGRFTQTDDSVSDEMNSGVTSTDQAYDLWLTYYYQKNLALTANYTYHLTDHVSSTDSNENIFTISAEYFLKDYINTNTSIQMFLTHSNFSDYENHPSNAIKFEMKWFFTDQKDLISVKRNGAIENRYNNYLDKPLWWHFPI